MKKINLLVTLAIAVSVMFTSACNQKDTETAGYAEDRALIEDLQARYLFALDFYDLDTYVSTFTEDGVLDIIEYRVTGHDAIRKAIEDARAVFNLSANEFPEGLYSATGRHNITNIVIKIDGDRAYGRSYWFSYNNDNPERRPALEGYGHYEDEMVKVNGKWLFSKRVIYNEGVKEWIAPRENPAW